jgi:3'(2'), 5'-bisphosphate nucleotidase
VRSEEGLEHVSGSGRLWIVDPLDGTREFRQIGRPDWAVHVALAIGGLPVVGAVALPAIDVTLTTAAPLELVPLDPSAPPRVVVSRSRPPEVAYEVADALGGVMIPMGSAGAKIGAVIMGLAEVYIHAGGQYEWDSCAPVAVAEASGLYACRLNGDPLRYGAPDAWLPDLMVCRPELAEAVLAVTKRDYRPYY